MAFVKKIIILNEAARGYGKSELRGLATVEKHNGKAVCRLTVFNLRDVKAADFLFGVKSENLRLQKFELTSTSQNFPLDKDTDIDGVVSCILVCKYTDKAVPLLFGSTDGKRIFEGNMADGFYDAAEPPVKVREETPQEETAEKELSEKEKKDEKKEKDGDKSEYEDYAVAAENFYPVDYGEDIIKAGGDEQNEPDGAHVYGQDGQKNESTDNDTRGRGSPLKGGKFYTAIKSQLDELFESYPKEEFLCSKLEGTDWVKVDYDNNGQYYTVGIIVEDETVKYICYGVPGKFAKNPPIELKGFCQWMPFDAESPESEGYWMMYQDAENGKSVTLEII